MKNTGGIIMRKLIISLVLIFSIVFITNCAKPQPVLQQAKTTTGGAAATVQTTAEATTTKTLSNAEIFISLYDARNNGTTKAKSVPTNKKSEAENSDENKPKATKNKKTTIQYTHPTQPTPPPVYKSDIPIATFPLYLFSHDGKVYLGKLTTNEYESESIWNKYGDYGSKYSSTSIWNKYGDYGSKYSSTSAFNKYATSPPKIVDGNGDFFGYLTASEYTVDGYSVEQIYLYLKDNHQ